MNNRKISPEFSRLVAKIVNGNRAVTDEEVALKKYIKLVLSIAKKYVRNNVEYEDLIMLGVIGLIEATRDFDPERSKNFGAYAVMRIKGRMYEYCINNTTTITVPTHVGKTRVYVERMTKLLERDPYPFRAGLYSEEIIKTWEHPEEQNLGAPCLESLRKIKVMVNKIAINSKTTYEDLVALAYRSMVIEVDEEEIGGASGYYLDNHIEETANINQMIGCLRENLGDKKTAVLLLHGNDFNNEDIAKEIYDSGLTPKKISRQAVRGLLKSAEKTAKKHVKPE